MNHTELEAFGNNALYNGKTYTFAQNLTKQQREFAIYLFSDERNKNLSEDRKKKVHKADIDHFSALNKKPKTQSVAEKAKDKPKDNPTEKPKESQK